MADIFARITGAVVSNSEQPITGRSGDHLQFKINAGGAVYQVDINTQSEDGSAIGVYITDQDLGGGAAPAAGVTVPASLSYQSLGLTDHDFTPMTYSSIESELETALGAALAVEIYGLTFDDGGPNGKGIHETHFNPKFPGQDGAVRIYSSATAARWYFFKFQADHIG